MAATCEIVPHVLVMPNRTASGPMESGTAHTEAVSRALQTAADETTTSDLLFLEAWEMNPQPGVAAARRAGQLRRANPALVAAIRAELAARQN